MSPASRRILVVDDEAAVRKVVARALHDGGYDVEGAEDRAGALRALTSASFDLVILDVELPDGNGIDVAREVLDRYRLPVMMLTMSGDEADVVRALSLGADDYVRKPFSPLELTARVASVLRRARAGRVPEGESLTAGAFELEPRSHRARIGGESISLTPTEFRLLEHLALHPDRIIKHDDLLQHVWGGEYLGEHHTLHVTVSRLRGKLKAHAVAIRTVSGVGYELITARS